MTALTIYYVIAFIIIFLTERWLESRDEKLRTLPKIVRLAMFMTFWVFSPVLFLGFIILLIVKHINHRRDGRN